MAFDVGIDIDIVFCAFGECNVAISNVSDEQIVKVGVSKWSFPVVAGSWWPKRSNPAFVLILNIAYCELKSRFSIAVSGRRL